MNDAAWRDLPDEMLRATVGWLAAKIESLAQFNEVDRSRVDVPRPHRQFRQRVTQQAMNLAWIPDFLHRCVEFLLPLLFLRRCFLADFGSPAGLGVIRGDKLHDLARSRRRVARYRYALPVGQNNFVELHRHLAARSEIRI